MPSKLFSNKKSDDKGFTLLELMIAIAIIGILAAISIAAYSTYVRYAYNIVAKHDLKNFVIAEEAYATPNGAYFGSAGDYIEDNPAVGTLAVPAFNYTTSAKVRVEIIAGSSIPPTTPLVIDAYHKLGDMIYTFNFSTGLITERKR